MPARRVQNIGSEDGFTTISVPTISWPKVYFRHGRVYMSARLYAYTRTRRTFELIARCYWFNDLNRSEKKYYATEREFYAVVWAITFIRPYTSRARNSSYEKSTTLRFGPRPLQNPLDI